MNRLGPREDEAGKLECDIRNLIEDADMESEENIVERMKRQFDYEEVGSSDIAEKSLNRWPRPEETSFDIDPLQSIVTQQLLILHKSIAQPSFSSFYLMKDMCFFQIIT